MTSTLHVMDRSGDTRTTWDKTVPAEVEAAKAMFDSAKGNGYLAYTVEQGGGKGEVIRDFDPNAEAIIMSPQTVGG
jgi:hypothetical protein